MIIPIYINSQDISDQFNISDKEVEDIIDRAIKNITVAFASEWEHKAMMTLKSTRGRYISNLKVIDEGRMMGAVLLDYSKDPIVRMIEEGASSFDQKIGFSKSSKKKIKKNDSGWYLTIPFSMGTPGVVEGADFSNTLPQDIYTQIKSKEVNPITGRSKGLTKNEIPDKYQPKTRSVQLPESGLFKEYKNKASFFQGAYKQKDTVTGQSSYGSFRRVSDKSDESSWIFPGIDANNLAEQAFNDFENKMQTILENSMDSALSFFGLE